MRIRFERARVTENEPIKFNRYLIFFNIKNFQVSKIIGNLATDKKRITHKITVI